MTTNGRLKRGQNGKPRTYTKQLTACLDEAVWDALGIAAAANGDTRSQLGRKLIVHGLMAQGLLQRINRSK